MPENNENEKFVSKVVYAGKTLIDLTGDTVVAEKLLAGFTAHGKDGAPIVGTCTFDVDSGDATVEVAEMLEGKTAYARSAKLVGTMPNKGGISEKINTVAQEVTIPQGYHDGSGKVAIAAEEQAKIIAGNIKQGVEILGVTGTCEPSSDVTAQSKEVTPSTEQQVVIPDEGTDYLAQVTVKAIPYVAAENAAGGMTVTIGG